MDQRRCFLLLAACLLPGPMAWAQLPLDVPLLIQEALTDDPSQPDFQLLPGAPSVQEPVAFGLPLPAGSGICDISQLGLSGGAAVGQFRVLRRWPNGACGGQGSAQWVLVDTQADVPAGGQNTALSLTLGSGNFGGAPLASDLGTTIVVDTGAAQFTVRKQAFNLFDAVSVAGSQLVMTGTSPGIEIIGSDGTPYRASNDAGVQVTIEENGPARAVIVARGVHRSAASARFLEFTVRMHFYRGRARSRVFYTLRNASEQQMENPPFLSLELLVSTTLTSPSFVIRNHAGVTSGTLGPAEEAVLFHGENTYPQFQDYDFTDFDGGGNVITTKWPSTISGYTIRRNATPLASGTRDQFINLMWAQASAAGGAVTVGTRFGAGWWPQGLRVGGDGLLRVGLWPAGNDKTYYSRFTSHVTHEVLFDFAVAAPNGDDVMTRFQYPLVGKAQDVSWYDESRALWERILSFDEERTYYQSLGLPTGFYPDSFRPDLFIIRHFYWGTGGGRNQYDQGKVGLHNFLRQTAPFAGGYWTQAEEKFLYNADHAVYHSDDFDGGRDDIPDFNGLPNIQFIPSAKVIFESEHLHAYGLPLWYYLSGDERIREAYTDWGDYLHHPRVAGYNPYERGLIWNIFNLIDVYRFTGDTYHRDLAWQFFQDEILDKTAEYQVSEGTDFDRGFYASFSDTFDIGGTGLPLADRPVFSFILGPMYPRAYAYMEAFGAADELQSDRARDMLEGMVRFVYREHWYEYSPALCDYGFPYFQGLDTVPPDPRPLSNWICGHKEVWPMHYWGYVLTGDPEFLRQATLMNLPLSDAGVTGEFQDWPDRQTLEHLQLHPDEHDLWQDLPLTVQNNGGGSYTLSWTVPVRARQYWIKYSDRQIVPWLNFDRNTRQYQFDPAQFIPFFAAQNAVGEPAPGAPGTPQSFTITGLNPGLPYAFAARVRIGAQSAAVSSLSIGDVSVTEGDAGTVNAVFPVSITPAAVDPVTVSYATADGTAVAGADYAATSGTLTLLPGASTAAITVPVNGDLLDEADEAFFVDLTGAAGGAIADGQGGGTINDDDPPPALSIADASAPEGNCSPSSAVFAVSVSAPSGQTVSVSYAAAPGTAAAGQDFEPVSGTLSFAAGTTSASIAVPIIDDFQDEPAEAFSVTLSSPLAATILDGQGTGTILDDDTPLLGLDRELHHGAWLTGDLAAAPGPVPDVDLFAIAARPRSSYEVVVDALSGDVVPLSLRRIGCGGAPVQSSVPVSGGASQSLRWQNATNATVSTERIEVKSGGCDVDCDAADSYRLRAYDTTALIPRFNNSASQISVLVLENTTDASVAGNAWFWGGDGALLGNAAFALGPRQSTAINTAAVPGVSGRSGAVTVSSDAPYGSLAGKAVAVEPATGFTFDTGMTSRPR